MSKVELFKIKTFQFKSEAKDVGLFEKKLKFLRRRPQLDTALMTTKSAMCGGLPPIVNREMMLLDAIATITVYVKEVDDHGNETESAEWINEIYDEAILFALHADWIGYQNSFYPTEKKQEETEQTGEVVNDGVQETPAAAAPQATV